MEEFGQNFAPDNEIAIAVNPNDPNHLVAGSNDYYYRFNNANGSRQAIVPTGFFTSFDGGATWIDGQIPVRTGNGAGDPAPAFDAKHDVVLMAQLENVAGAGGFWVSQGDVSVSRSTDGGVTWSEPVTVLMGTGAGIGVDPTDPDHVTIVFADRGTPNPNATEGCFLTESGGLNIGTAPDYDPCEAGPGSDTDVYKVESTDGGAMWGPRTVVEDTNGPAWFAWADSKSDGTLVVAWDQDTGPAPADTFNHVLKVGNAPAASLGPTENPDESVTHWAGQYTSAWPEICGPTGSSTPGKGCNIFHGDYTGLAVGPDDSITFDLSPGRFIARSSSRSTPSPL